MAIPKDTDERSILPYPVRVTRPPVLRQNRNAHRFDRRSPATLSAPASKDKASA